MSNSSHWILPYIGLRHALGGRDRNGVDCWGLLYLVYREHFGIELPVFPGVTVAGLADVVDLIQREVDSCWFEVVAPFDGAAVAMSQKSAMHHVGLYAEADGGKVIHCWNSQNVIVETLASLRRFKGFRTIKFYRHKLWPIS